MGLLQRSMSAGILIICTLLLRRVAGRKLPKWTFPLLWKVAILRLLLPFALPVENVFFRRKATFVLASAQRRAEYISEGRKAVGMEGLIMEHAGLVWLFGVGVLSIYFIAGYMNLCYRLREAIPIPNDIIVGEICPGLTPKVKVKISDRIATPITYGIFRPRIILPKTMDFQDRNALYCVCRHEEIHIRRMDNLWKLLMISALCLHWFNPFVLAMYFVMSRDMEMACDESVVFAMGENDRRKYAMTLVMFAEIQSSFPNVCSEFGQSAVSERIKEIMNYKKITKIGSLCAALVLLGSMAVFVSAKETGTQGDVVSEPLLAADVMEEETVIEEKAGIDEKKAGMESVKVFFDEDISGERKEEIGNELLSIKQVESVEYTSSEAAWEMFADKYLNEDIKISFKGNPLEESDSYTVYLSEKNDAAISAIQSIDGIRRIGGQ